MVSNIRSDGCSKSTQRDCCSSLSAHVNLSFTAKVLGYPYLSALHNSFSFPCNGQVPSKFWGENHTAR